MPPSITLDSLIRAVEDSAPDDRVGQLGHAASTAAELGELGDSLLGVFVDRCRRDGRSWAEIGAALGVTKQAVQQRFVKDPTGVTRFERFTDRAQRVVAHASMEAHTTGAAWVGTEHLLLGVYDEPEGFAALVLTRLGVTTDAVRAAVQAGAASTESAQGGDGKLAFTPRAVRALELALSSALELGHNYIGTEHLLLGLLREGEGLAARVLTGLGVTHDAVKASVVAVIGLADG